MTTLKMMNRRNYFVFIFTLSLAMAGMGCTGLHNGNMALVQTTSVMPRAGNVYLIRGWIGVFSTGMDTLGDQIRQAGVRSQVYQDTQHVELADQIASVYRNQKNAEPIVLIGHSYGADDVVRVARRLDEAGIPVDLLLTIDATTPPKVPKNVKLCLNYYQSNVTDVVPMFRGIPLEAEDGANVKIINMNIRKDRTDLLVPGTNHINIDKNMKLHDQVLKDVLNICPPRQVWAAQHGAATSQPVYGSNAKVNGTVHNAAEVRTLN
jgi:pimeloyl-ACP methyl ester carboxylesterase